MSAPKPSFFRFLVCCPFGAHRRIECECCGAPSCLDCSSDLSDEPSEVEA